MNEFFDFFLQAPGLSATSAYAAILIAIIAGLSFKVWRDRPTSILFIYCVLAFIFALLEIYVVWFIRIESTFVHNIWGILSLVTLATYFYLLLQNYRKLVFRISAILILLSLSYTLFGSGWDRYASIARIVESAGLIFFTLIGFYRLFVLEEDQDPLGSQEIWLLSGMLIYLTGSLFSFLLSDWILSEDQNAIMGMWYVHNFFNLLRYLLFAIGFWRVARVDKTQSSLRHN